MQMLNLRAWRWQVNPVMMAAALALQAGVAETRTEVSVPLLVSSMQKTNCFSDVFRSDAAVPPVRGLWLDRKDQELGVAFAVDGPVPRNDLYRQFWDGRTAGASVRVSILKIDYADTKLTDRFSASISFAAGEVMSVVRVERELGVTLSPYRADQGWKGWYKGTDGERFYLLTRFDLADGQSEWRLKCDVSDQQT